MTRGQVAGEIERPALRWERANGQPVDYGMWPERPTTIGREPTNTIAIDSPFVSKAHAIFQCSGGHYVIEDLGSSNGTRVNGALIEAAAVDIGDIVEIGDERFVFVDRTADAAPAGRQALGKNAKLAIVAGGVVLASFILFGLLLAPPESPHARQETRPGRPTAGPPTVERSVATETTAVRDVVERAERAGVKAVDALLDEATVHYRVGRLREAAELFGAAVARDPRNELARGRYAATTAALAQSIDEHVSEAERAWSQLRYGEAAREWEQVSLLTDVNDRRHAQAEAGAKRARDPR